MFTDMAGYYALRRRLSPCCKKPPHFKVPTLNQPTVLLGLLFLSVSLSVQAHAAGPALAVFPQGIANAFRATQTCSPNSVITSSSITIKMGTCSPEFADVNAREQQFYVDSASWNAVFNGTNAAPTTTNPPNEMVGFLTDDIVNFDKHEIGIICKLDQGLFVGYYQDHTADGTSFQTTGSLGSCRGSSILTEHNFSLTISYNGTANTFVYAVDSTTWTLNYASSTNYSRLLFWWWMTIHRNGSWNVPTGTETVYNSVSVIQDVQPVSSVPNPHTQQSASQQTQQSTPTPVSNPSRYPSYSFVIVGVLAAASVPAIFWLVKLRKVRDGTRSTGRQLHS